MLYKMICEQGTEGRLANASFDVAEYDNLVFMSMRIYAI